MAHCPTCGQPLPRQRLNAEQLLHVLTHGHPQREVYEARDGGWYVTYGGGEVDPAAVQALVRGGHIRSKYSNSPNDCFYVGQTIDVERSLDARRKHGRKTSTIYVGDVA